MNIRKMVAACVLAISGTIVMTVSKTSLLFLWACKPSTPTNQWYATLCLVMVIPEVVSIARTLWGSTLLVSGSFVQWPPFRLVVLDILIAILESAAMTFFTTEVAAALPVYIVLPLMNAVLLLQSLLDQWRPSRKPLGVLEAVSSSSCSLACRAFGSVLCFLGMVGLVVLASMLVVLNLVDITEAVALVASLLALSVVWCKPVRRHILSPDRSSIAQRHNVTLLLCVVKVVCLVGFSILTSAIGATDRRLSQAPESLWQGFLVLHQREILVYPLIAHSLSNILACAHTRLGTYYTATRSSLVLPTVLSTLVATILLIVTCTGALPLDVGLEACQLRSTEIAFLAASAVLWLIPFATLRQSYFHPAHVLFRPEIESFLAINYNSVCFDQNLFLNYNPFSITFGEYMKVGEKQSRVFLCTTMYREADYEMEQLLRSLSRVSISKKLRAAGVYLESHIFLDNGANGMTLNEFALQLMSLVEKCFSLTRTESAINKTPSGIQIVCILPGGMPLFLHLKDSSLVKAKKRWSQVMYMKYILDHRIKATCRESVTNMPRKAIDEMRVVQKNSATEGADNKNSEILLQIRSLLNGLKVEEKASEDGNRDSVRNSITEERCESEQSSDQGIDIADDISDSSSQKETSKVPDDSQNTTASDPALNRDSSYSSLLSGNLHQGKINPAYVPDEDEEAPPKWLPQFVSKFLGASPMHESEGESTSADLSLPPREVVEIFPEPVYTLPDSGPHQANSADASGNVEAPSVLCPEQGTESLDKQTYILATDADMLFSDTAVLDLVNACNEDLRLGAACGRTYPMGKKINPIVWYQIFEYAKDFWMIKSAQNVIGSVMCCPGCFSLYRASAINDVVGKYSEPTTRAGDVFTKDTGEDRWMCTLMMMKGWKLRYSTYAVNSTYCPDSISEFIKQRRRWILSDFANSFLVFRNLPRLMRSNGCFSFMYALYLVQLFIIVIFSPGTTVVMLTVGVELLTGAPYHVTTPVMAMIFVLYGLTCCLLSPEVQVRVTKFSIIVLGISMAAVVIGAGAYVLIDMIKSIQLGGLSLMEHYLLLALTGSLIYAALMHPKECYILVYGIVYLFYFPAMYMLLPLYALCNIVDQSWGTRDNQKPKVPKLICFPRIRRKKQKKARDPGSCENLSEDPAAVSQEIKSLSPEEESFWTRLVVQLIGKNVNLGLSMEDLAKGLRNLRFRVVVAVMVLNLLWVIGLSFFYLWSFKSGSQISAYGILNGVLYAFSFFIQIVGMTVYRVQDGVHRLGKKIYGTEKPYYVRSADER